MTGEKITRKLLHITATEVVSVTNTRHEGVDVTEAALQHSPPLPLDELDLIVPGDLLEHRPEGHVVGVLAVLLRTLPPPLVQALLRPESQHVRVEQVAGDTQLPHDRCQAVRHGEVGEP